MRSLITALAAAGLAMATLSGYAGEESTVKSKPDLNRPGRQIEESTVKSKPDLNRPGRQIEKEQAAKAAAPSEQPAHTAEKK
jgi:hypothetical protein